VLSGPILPLERSLVSWHSSAASCLRMSEVISDDSTDVWSSILAMGCAGSIEPLVLFFHMRPCCHDRLNVECIMPVTSPTLLPGVWPRANCALPKLLRSDWLG